MSPLVKISRNPRTPEAAYVSFNGGKSWLVVHPDGTVTVQYRTPPYPLAFGTYYCRCEDEDEQCG